MKACACVLCSSILARNVDPDVTTLYKLQEFLGNDAHETQRSFKIWVDLWVYGKKVQALALIDTGATISVINSDFVDENHLVTHDKSRPLWVRNADGTLNRLGVIKKEIRGFMQHGEHKENVALSVMKMHNLDIILGYDWLLRHNPTFNWKSGTISYDQCLCGTCHNPTARTNYTSSEDDAVDDEDACIEHVWDSTLDALGEEETQENSTAL